MSESKPYCVDLDGISVSSSSTEGMLKMCCAVQMDMQVFSPSGGFDEGADHVHWQNWAA